MTTIELTGAAGSVPTVVPRYGVARFIGDARAYWRLLIRGAALLMVTLGIYRFWLNTDMRRFLWANTEIAGHTLEYTGTARELLLGFLIAIAILVPLNVSFFLLMLYAGLEEFAGVVGFALLTVFGHFAIYRARRYRLTRTVYRGVRCHQTGSAWRYAVCAIFWWSLNILTLGLFYPLLVSALERLKLRNTYYGNLGGRFEGSAGRLFVRGVGLWLVVMGPLLAGLLFGALAVDWQALIAAAGTKNAGSALNDTTIAALIAAGLALLWVILRRPRILSGLSGHALALVAFRSSFRFDQCLVAAAHRPSLSNLFEIHRLYIRLRRHRFDHDRPPVRRHERCRRTRRKDDGHARR